VILKLLQLLERQLNPIRYTVGFIWL